MFCLCGSIEQSGEYWAIEVPLLNIYTQGKDRDDAFRMLKDAMEELSGEKDFYIIEEYYDKFFGVLPTENLSPLLTFFVNRAQRFLEVKL